MLSVAIKPSMLSFVMLSVVAFRTKLAYQGPALLDAKFWEEQQMPIDVDARCYCGATTLRRK
jgi:hypothetical protein